MKLIISTLLIIVSLNGIKMLQIIKNKSLTKAYQSIANRWGTEKNNETNTETFEFPRNANDYYKNRKICRSNLVYKDIWDKLNVYSKLKSSLNKNCSYVIGNVIIAHITNEDLTFLNSIEEITGFLFLYSNSIESISLNKLKIIRGENPWIYKEVRFSFILVSNLSGGNLLKYLLMPNFQVVLEHNILIFNNPGLLHVKSKINWNSILSKNQNVEIVEPNISLNFSTNVDGKIVCHSSCRSFSGKQFCWGKEAGQCQIINDCANKNCKKSDKCYFHDKLKIEQCCHEECAGGCYGPFSYQCLICKHLNNNGDCVRKCPKVFAHDGVKYTKNPLGKLIFHNNCVDKCPDKFFVESEKCVSNCTEGITYALNRNCLPCPNKICPKVCRVEDIVLNYKVSYLIREMLSRLENCTVYHGNIVINTLSIEGSLTDNLSKEIHGVREQDLGKLTNLNEIYGYLEISVGSTAPWLKTLLYLRNLRIVRANTIESNKSNGLSIIHNDNLIFLGLHNLKEVRNGDVTIMYNQKLCFTDTLINESIYHKNLIYISHNGKYGNCKSRNCSKVCDLKYGCWGPLAFFCVKCRHFQIPDSNMCISNCSKQPGYFYNEENNLATQKQCSKCHHQCLPINSTCFGPSANQCTFGCVNYKYNGYCVEKCPQNHYGDGPTFNICKSCHPSCTKESLFSFQATCTGSRNYIGINGCGKCNNVQLELKESEYGFDNTNHAYSFKCLNLSNNCSEGYFKAIVDFHSLENLTSLLYLYSNNLLIYTSLETWIDKQTNHEFQFGSICLPCHPLCSQCSDGSIENCSLCKYYRMGSQCIKNCDGNDFIHYNYKNEKIGEKNCLKCHEECLDSCSGSTEYDCEQCKKVKIYFNSSKTQFFCNSTCGDNEMICVQPGLAKYMSVSQFFIGISGVLIIAILTFVIIAKIVWSSLKKTKRYDLTLNYQSDSCSRNNQDDVTPSSTKLLLIPDSQLTSDIKMDVETTGIMHRGISGPNIVNSNGQNSCLSKYIFKLLPDKSVKLNMVVKVFPYCSDVDNNKDILEDLKTNTSVDHLYNLKILVVYFTEHLKFITQFVPFGRLLESVRKNSSLIDDISLFLWSHQISRGIEHLEFRGIIHCDLEPSKNDGPQQVKISDFGMSKENVKNQIFSTESNIWSYGWKIDSDSKASFTELKHSIEMMVENPNSYIILKAKEASNQRQIVVVNDSENQLMVNYYIKSNEENFSNLNKIKDNSTLNYAANKDDLMNSHHHIQIFGKSSGKSQVRSL